MRTADYRAGVANGDVEPPAQYTPFAAGLARTARIGAVAVLAVWIVELVVQPHRLMSLLFVVVGVLVGYGIGRSLASTVIDWSEDAAPLTSAERSNVLPNKPSALAIVVLIIVVAIGLEVPIRYNFPSPVPGGLLAIAMQAWLQERALVTVGRRRGGAILRPMRRLSFDREALRFRSDGPDESAQPRG